MNIDFERKKKVHPKKNYFLCFSTTDQKKKLVVPLYKVYTP